MVFIYKNLHYFKLCNVKTITPINIETARCDEFHKYKDIDIITANNSYAYAILKNIFGNKVKLMQFNNYWFPKNSNTKNLENVYNFACFGGLNSICRKNIDKIYNCFSRLSGTKFNNFILNIYIQGNDHTIEDQSGKEYAFGLFPTDKIRIVFNNSSYADVLKNVRANDFYIHLGDHEGLGLGFFESFNNNRPVISINTSPNDEYVIHKYNGYLIDCSWIDLQDNNQGVSEKLFQ